MSATAQISAGEDRTTAHPSGQDAAARAAELKAANINPQTGLSTDYLNHFNEAIMLLEMIPDMPECSEDFLQWAPLSYAEHFTASHFRARELAISAYQSADPEIRAEFDQMTDTMTSILNEVSIAMRAATQDSAKAMLAAQAIGWLKPLVAAAGGGINGGDDGGGDGRAQAAGGGRRRRHQWRLRGRRRDHHGGLTAGIQDMAPDPATRPQ